MGSWQQKGWRLRRATRTEFGVGLGWNWLLLGPGVTLCHLCSYTDARLPKGPFLAFLFFPIRQKQGWVPAGEGGPGGPQHKKGREGGAQPSSKKEL